MNYQNAAVWPLKPGSKTSGTVNHDPASTTRTMICSAQLQDGLPARVWRVVVCYLGNTVSADFAIVIGDQFATSLVTSDGAGTQRTLLTGSIPGYGFGPIPPFYTNWAEFTVVGTSVTVYGIPNGVWLGQFPCLFAAVAPEGISYPLVEP